jgi:ectoine hydroxylase-related dioxygenase (phytanoyl-CoA dioxygenase family)
MYSATARIPHKVVTGFDDSTPLLDSPDELRLRADEDGFLYFKNFLPKDEVMELRRQVLQILDKHGWLKRGVDMMEAVGDREAIARDAAADPDWVRLSVGKEAYCEIQSLELFNTLPHHPKLIAFYEMFLGEPVIPHPRHIARIMMPAETLAPTPPHQDYIYIQGSHSFWTCWYPIGDCPMTMGGLSMLRGSHREEVLDFHIAPGAGGFESLLCDMDYTWVQGDYECGDFVTFPSHMVHKSLPTQMPERIRLSSDTRYQPVSAEFQWKSLLPHMRYKTWDEIYSGWKSEDLKYYWKKYPLRMIDWDPSLAEPTNRIC